MNRPTISVILLDVRSSQNVGAIFRTADAAGVSHIYLVGYTPSPLDRFGRKNKELIKASLGAEETVSWEKTGDVKKLIADFKKTGTKVIAVEQASASVPYTALMRMGEVAFIFGNEVEGIPKNILALCDAVVEIPMHGKKESLNVSVAAGVVLFQAIR